MVPEGDVVLESERCQHAREYRLGGPAIAGAGRVETVEGEHLVGLRQEERSDHIRKRHRPPARLRDDLTLCGGELARRSSSHAAKRLRYGGQGSEIRARPDN